MSAIQQNKLPIEREILSITDQYNEYVMTGLRTIWGVSLEKVTKEFGKEYHTYLLLQSEIPITEYLPKKIKNGITGNGNATKEQVALMLKSLLNLKTLPKNLDATDGLAAAVCHFYNAGKITQGKNYSGWGAFVKQNPKKIN